MILEEKKRASTDCSARVREEITRVPDNRLRKFMKRATVQDLPLYAERVLSVLIIEVAQSSSEGMGCTPRMNRQLLPYLLMTLFL